MVDIFSTIVTINMKAVRDQDLAVGIFSMIAIINTMVLRDEILAGDYKNHE